MATKLEISNLATTHLGAGRPIDNIDTDSTNEANAIRRVYDTTLKTMLREFRWPFSVRYKALEHVNEGYGEDLTLDLFDAATSYSEVSASAVEVLQSALVTTTRQHIDCTVGTAAAGLTAGYVTVTLQGGPSGFASATDIQTVGYFAYDAPAGTRITAAVAAADVTGYAAFRLKFVASTGTPTAGVYNCFMAERKSVPVDEWSYSYEYPTDALYLVRIGGADRTDAYDTRVPYKIVHNRRATDLSETSWSIQQQILTDEDSACAEYVSTDCLVSSSTAELIFPEDFVQAFSLRLAINIAPRITGGDNGILVKSLHDRYYLALSNAEANAMNEMGSDLPRDSEYIRARD